MMTFLLFAPASTKDRKSRRDRSGRFCDIYCSVILRKINLLFRLQAVLFEEVYLLWLGRSKKRPLTQIDVSLHKSCSLRGTSVVLQLKKPKVKTQIDVFLA